MVVPQLQDKAGHTDIGRTEAGVDVAQPGSNWWSSASEAREMEGPPWT